MDQPTQATNELPRFPRFSPRDRVALLGGSLALSAIAMLMAIQPPTMLIIERPMIMFVLALAFGLSERLVFHIEARNEAVSYSPSEMALAIGLLLLNPLEVLLARQVGAGLGMAITRRPPAFKFMFNLSLLSFETVLAAFIFRWLDAFDGGILGTWFALVVSLGIALPAGGIAVTTAVAQFDGDLRQRVRREILNGPVLHLPGIVFAASVALPMAVDPRLGVVALVPAPVVWIALRSHGALIQRFTDLASVHDFSRDIGDAADLRAIAETAAARFGEHLRAERVALRLWMPDGTTIDAKVGDVSFDLVPEHPEEVGWRRVLARREAERVSNLDHDLRKALESTDFLRGIIAPIADEQGQLGVAIVGDRNGASDEFDEDDASRLTAMSQQLAVAVRKGQLHSQIQFEATHDRLTSLPNRSFFENWISQSAGAGDAGAVLMLDLDRFKQINDAFGHHAGDVLLTKAAVRIRAACAPDDVVARFGGDEFAVFAPRKNGEEAQILAESISEALEDEFDIGPANVAIGASIGIALLPEHEQDATNLLRCADIAMYDAKTRRIRFSTYRSELEENSAERLTLLNDLRAALKQQKIEVHFQPQVALCSGRVCGVEALARWEHPELGRIRPDIFIEIAEQAGLIEELTSQVLNLATSAAADWHREGLDLSVSVNISAQSLLDERLESIVAETLLTSAMKPELLILEITESTMMVDAARTDRVLHGLSKLGVRLSVDDFGTGFSSLVNLRNLPVDELKIDRSFVTEMMVKHDDDVIVRSTIDLAHNLGLQVVAEGVETDEVLHRLAELQCDIAQGFGISRPIPRAMFEAWLADRGETSTKMGEMSTSSANSHL